MIEKAGESARHHRRFIVRTYESDYSGRLRPASLLNYFQEAAGEHAEELGAGIVELMKQNLTWVISRYHIKIFRYPRWKSPVDLTTWPCGHQGLFALREFELKDEKGRLLAAATSSWMLLDVKTKKPVPPAERLGPYPKDPRRAVASTFEPLPALERADLERTFSVRMSDLDWNRHVNHVVYISWALETGSPDFLEKHRPAEIEVEFRGEAFYGDTVTSRMQTLISGPASHIGYAIIKEDGRKELARLRILWQE
ncbi:MAG: acyl-ACP thioesterase domain-containing protein [Candidatus Aminicenantales bacterium]